MKTWALQFDQCKECLTTTHPHHAKGLCTSCYQKQYKRKIPPKRKDAFDNFLDALPSLLKEAGIIGYIISHDDNGVTLKKLGSKLSATWKFPD